MLFHSTGYSRGWYIFWHGVCFCMDSGRSAILSRFSVQRMVSTIIWHALVMFHRWIFPFSSASYCFSQFERRQTICTVSTVVALGSTRGNPVSGVWFVWLCLKLFKKFLGWFFLKLILGAKQGRRDFKFESYFPINFESTTGERFTCSRWFYRLFCSPDLKWFRSVNY